METRSQKEERTAPPQVRRCAARFVFLPSQRLVFDFSCAFERDVPKSREKVSGLPWASVLAFYPIFSGGIINVLTKWRNGHPRSASRNVHYHACTWHIYIYTSQMLRVACTLLLLLIPPTMAIAAKLAPLKASSGTEGFFQPHPKLESQFHEDVVLNRIFKCT